MCIRDSRKEVDLILAFASTFMNFEEPPRKTADGSGIGKSKKHTFRRQKTVSENKRAALRNDPQFMSMKNEE
eukprot:1346493-Prorocentrum_lima.AAC.1